MRLNVTGVNNLAKLIEALTDKQNYYEFRIWTDEFQSFQPNDKRGYVIDIADHMNDEQFVLDSPDNET
jgi:hypothetical protein